MRTKEIVVETYERIVVRRLPTAARRVCRQCAAETVFLAPQTAGVFFDLTLRQIFRGIESGTIHAIEMTDRTTLVCLESLAATIRETEKCTLLY